MNILGLGTDIIEIVRIGQMIEKHGVNLHLNTKADAQTLIQGQYDEVILATGVTPRKVDFEGADHPKVLTYADVLYKKKPVGRSVAIVGAGGIGYDTAEYLTHDHNQIAPSMDIQAYMKEWISLADLITKD